MNGNSFIKFILRSPLHGLLSNNTMLITVTGRKTGRLITTPVNYARDNNVLWIISKRDRKWWRNLRGGAPVYLILRGKKDVKGFAEVILDPEMVVPKLAHYIRRIPYSARSLGISIEAGKPNVDDLARVAREWLIVSIKSGMPSVEGCKNERRSL